MQHHALEEDPSSTVCILPLPSGPGREQERSRPNASLEDTGSRGGRRPSLTPKSLDEVVALRDFLISRDRRDDATDLAV